MTGGTPFRPVTVLGADHLIRAGIAALLEAAGFPVACHSPALPGWSLPEAIEPGALLVALPAPPDLEGALASLLPHQARTVLVSPAMSPQWVWAAGEANIAGLTHLHETPEFLLAAITEVAAGRRYSSPAIQQVRRTRLVRTDAFFRVLSPRELEVLAGVCRGDGDDLIARSLGISPLTVGVHRRNIRQKISAHSDRDLVRYANYWGLNLAAP